jgi:hypothetical protein
VIQLPGEAVVRRPFFLGAGHFLKAIAPEHAGPIKKADHKEREQTPFHAGQHQDSWPAALPNSDANDTNPGKCERE